MAEYGSLRRHLGALPFELVMLGGAVVTFSTGNWKHLAASLFTFFVSLLPLFIERRFKVKLSAMTQTVYVGFIFASMFSGEVLGMYGRIWPWDDVMHFSSGLLVGMAVMFWLTIFVRRRKQLEIPAWIEAIMITCIATTVSVIWEVAEFGSDELLGTFSQGDDLFDTMLDLIYGMMSGLIMSCAWMLHSKKRKVFIVSAALSQFERLNSRTSV